MAAEKGMVWLYKYPKLLKTLWKIPWTCRIVKITGWDINLLLPYIATTILPDADTVIKNRFLFHQILRLLLLFGNFIWFAQLKSFVVFFKTGKNGVAYHCLWILALSLSTFTSHTQLRTWWKSYRKQVFFATCFIALNLLHSPPCSAANQASMNMFVNKNWTSPFEWICCDHKSAKSVQSLSPHFVLLC